MNIIMQYLAEWNVATKKAASSSTSSVCFLSWQKPRPGFHKLNVDSTRSRTGMIGVGGVIKDCNGQLVCWFHEKY